MWSLRLRGRRNKKPIGFRQWVVHNIDLLNRIVDEYGFDKKDIGEQFLSEQWERFDVLIRLCLVREYFDNIFSEFLS